KAGAVTLGTGTLKTTNGVAFATLTTSALPLGADTLTAVYGGDPGDLVSTSAAFKVTVGPDATKTVGGPSGSTIPSGQAVTLYAVVSPVAPGSGAATGVVVFEDGPALLGTGNVVTANGLTYAAFTTSTLKPGVHAITALYQGDPADRPSTA